jgi:NADPH-ferrihemoprotein reductase
MSDSSDPFNPITKIVAIGSGLATLLLGSALAYVLLDRKDRHFDEEEKEESTETTEAFSREEFPGGQINVYYATQTGTAESFAKQLEREGAEHGFFVKPVDVEDVELENLVQVKDAESGTARAIFLTATYGEGEPPDTAAQFVQMLREKLGVETLFQTPDSDVQVEQCLVGLDYCVFGLGNRQYEHFNAMGKFFDLAFSSAGANRLLEIGLGDDDDDLDGDFEAWKDNKLWPVLKKKFLGDAVIVSPAPKNTLPDCQYIVEYHGYISKPTDMSPDKVHSSSRHYFTAEDCGISTIRELRGKEDGGSTVHVEIDLSDAKLSYETADNLGVMPVNSSTVVESVAKSLGLDLNKRFSVKAAPHHEWHGAPFPMPLTVRECLKRYCDLTSAPRRSDLKLLASYAKDPTDKNALIRMSSKEGKKEYREKILDGYVGLADLLKRCPSIEMTLEHFLSLCPPLHARFFTISSSSSVHPKSVHLTVAVTKAERSDGSTFEGVCSNYLAGSQPCKSLVRVFNRASTFRLPKDESRPIIMIGPGTGIAPMRAFLQERSYQRTKLQKKVGLNILYFGCKKESQDFIYQEELKAFQDSNDLHQLHLAFSREQNEKVYVQHLLLKNAVETWKLVNEDGAHVYVCGGVKMGHDVSEAIKEICCSQGSMSAEQARDYISSLSGSGRFVQELWA